MKVADFQRHLGHMADFLAGAGAKMQAADLTAVRDALSAFQADDLKQFAEFLGRAKAYRDGGEVPLKAPRGGAKPKAPKADPVELARRARDMYDRAADPSVTAATIDELAAGLTGLAKPELVKVAEGLDLAGMAKKTKPVILQEIRNRITLRKGATQRAGIADRDPHMQTPRPEGDVPIGVPVA